MEESPAHEVMATEAQEVALGVDVPYSLLKLKEMFLEVPKGIVAGKWALNLQRKIGELRGSGT